MVEYGVLVLCLLLIALTGIEAFGNSVNTKFGDIDKTLKENLASGTNLPCNSPRGC